MRGCISNWSLPKDRPMTRTCWNDMFIAGCPAKNRPTAAQAGLFRGPKFPRHLPNIRWHVLSCVLLGSFFASSVAAQSASVGITHHTWGMEDGLPDRVIQAIAQTPDGYL